MGIHQGASRIDVSTALSFEGDMDVQHVVCEHGSKAEFTIADGSIVSMTFSAASLRRFHEEVVKALKAMTAV